MVRQTAGKRELSGTGREEERGWLTGQQSQWLLDSRMQGAALGLEKAKTRPQPVPSRALFAQFLGSGGRNLESKLGDPCPPCLNSKEGRG